MNRGLIGVVRREPVLGMNSVYADKNFVDEHLAGVALRHISDEGEPVAAEKTPRHADLDFCQVAELHRDIEGIGQDGNGLAMADAARHLCRRGARSYGNNLAVGDQARRHQPYPAFLGRAFLFLLVKGGNMAERLIQHRGNQNCTAVIAPQKTLSFQLAQVAANGSRGDLKMLRQALNGDLAIAQELLQDLLRTPLRGDVLSGHSPLLVPRINARSYRIACDAGDL